MIWLTWRQFRVPAAAVFGGLAALATLLAITGPSLAHDYATGISVCSDRRCTDEFIRQFFNDHQTTFLAATAVVLILPALIGLFWGAPLITRELEAGTHRLVWNQSITRSRWLTVKLAIPGLAAMAAGGLGSLAVTWWSSTFDRSAAIGNFPRLASIVFDARGVVPIAYSAFAFAVGVAIGMLVRRGLAAMAVTLVAFVAVQVAMPTLVRPYLLPPIRSTVEISPSVLNGFSLRPGGPIQLRPKAPDPGGWLLSGQTLDPSGKAVDSIPLPAGSGPCAAPEPSTPGSADPMLNCFAEFNRVGYRLQLTYHPPSRFWPFQGIESGIYLGLALILTGFCFWWLRRHLA